MTFFGIEVSELFRPQLLSDSESLCEALQLIEVGFDHKFSGKAFLPSFHELLQPCVILALIWLI